MLDLNLGFRFASFILLFTSIDLVESECIRGCDLALASYYAEPGDTLISISTYMDTNDDIIIKYNPNIITILDNNNNNDIRSAGRINIPFPCDCIDGDFLGHVFSYQVQPEDSNYEIASQKYANLTTYDWITRFNSIDMNRFVINSRRNVTVNCSCGDSSVSRDYGLFVTYPLRQGESLDSISLAANLSSDLIRRYNPDADFSAGRGLVYIPGRDENGNYPPLRISSERGLSNGGAIGGITASVVAGMLLLAGGLYYGFCIKKDPKNSLASFKKAQVQLMQDVQSVTVDKSVEFSYKELSKVTDDFSLANKIGQGGFGAVFYAELRGKKAAIKKMDMKASREFLAELKVLTHVHHLNLVRLIGYCVEGSLFLVYEYIENGNLSQHLHESGRDPLPWSTRVQIALDSAQGLEYIHEHTVPVYIHRDIKSANILIDKNFRAKVADFGLAKLTEVGGASLPTRLVGTFGYMPAEYARYGTVSPKVDVYAFGVVLYELISGKKAVVKSNGFDAEAKGLVALFDEVLGQPDPKDDMVKMIDPRLGDSYPLDSVLKMAELAKTCTHENPQLRPNMRSIVVALMTLLSTMEDLDVGPFYENEIMVNLMSAE